VDKVCPIGCFGSSWTLLGSISQVKYTTTGTGWLKESVELILQNLVLFANSFLKLTRIG